MEANEQSEAVPSDEVIAAELEQLVVLGDLELGEPRANGEKTYRLTAQGKARVEADLRAAGLDPDELTKNLQQKE